MWKYLKKRMARLLWRADPWTDCVDQIEKAMIEIHSGKAVAVQLRWHLEYLEPPNNRFKITIERERELSGVDCAH